MKKLPAQKQTFQKFRPYELGNIKLELTNQDKLYRSQLSIKILGVHFVNFALDSNNWDIINDR